MTIFAVRFALSFFKKEEVIFLAAEAVLRINEAEEQGREILRKASDRARQITSGAEKEAKDKAKNMIAEAQKTRQAMIDAARQEAEKGSQELLAGGEAERNRLLSLEPARRRDAIDFVMKKVVGDNGNH